VVRTTGKRNYRSFDIDYLLWCKRWNYLLEKPTQIIELGKDSPMDAVTKASILALEKDKVVDSAVIKMNREVNKLIRKIAKKLA